MKKKLFLFVLFLLILFGCYPGKAFAKPLPPEDLKFESLNKIWAYNDITIKWRNGGTGKLNAESIGVKFDDVIGFQVNYQCDDGDEIIEESEIVEYGQTRLHFGPIQPGVYRLNVQAIDSRREYSEPSQNLVFSILPAVTNVTCEEKNGNVLLTWKYANKRPMPNATHFWIIRNRNEGDYGKTYKIKQGSAKNTNIQGDYYLFEDKDVQNGQSYNYVIVAVGANDVKSPPTKEKTITVKKAKDRSLVSKGKQIGSILLDLPVPLLQVSGAATGFKSTSNFSLGNFLKGDFGSISKNTTPNKTSSYALAVK